MSLREHPDFARVWAGLAVSNVGDGVNRIAVLWWARQATGSDAIVVLVALATVVPSLAAAPLAGWLVDRFPRRRLMLIADVVRCGTSALLAGAVLAGSLTTAVVVAISIVAAVAAAVFDPALLSSITLMVPAEERVVANSRIGATGALAGIAGPALGGVLIGLVGTGAALAFDAGSFLVSFVLIAASRIPMPERSEGDGADGGMAAGWNLVRSDRGVRDLVVVAAGLNLCVAPVGVLIVGLAAGPLALGGSGYGLLEASIPLGIVAGFVLAPKVAGAARAALFALLLTGAGIAASGAAPWAVWSGLAFVVAGVGVGVANSIIPTRFQESVEPAVQGRVFALVGALSQAGRPLGLLLAAPLMTVAGVRGALAVCGLGLAAVAWAGRGGLASATPVGAGSVRETAIGVEFDECLG